jgi:hypothetical protein
MTTSTLRDEASLRKLTLPEYNYVRRRVERRLQRVQERMGGPADEPDHILDDFFVLWRAFEVTFDLTLSKQSELMQRVRIEKIGELAKNTVADTVDHKGGINPLLRVRDFASGFTREVRKTSDGYILEWFRGDPEGSEEQVKRLRQNCQCVQAGLDAPWKWDAARKSNSYALAKILYSLRNAVFHGRFRTSVDNAPRHLNGLRQAMIELLEVRLHWMETYEPKYVREKS